MIMKKEKNQISLEEIPRTIRRKIHRTIPDNEKRWVSYRDKDGNERFVLTSTPYRDKYFLYAINPDGGVQKIGEDTSPQVLETSFDVLSKIRKTE